MLSGPKQLALGVAAAAALLASTSRLRADPSAAPAAPADASPSAQCGTCHVAEAASWRASAHAKAWSSAVFQAAYRLEPRAFCRGCHAPLGDPAHEPSPAAAAQGVGCTACHTSPHVPPSRDATGASVARPCERCHEFAFPGAPPSGRAPTLMQTTAREHRESVAGRAGSTCVDCHMPREGAGPRDHGVAIDGAFVRSALSITVHARRSGRRVSVRFELVTRAGHAVPTGDMMRRLELRAWVDGGPVARVELARGFGDVREGGRSARIEVADDRVPADGRALVRELELDGPPTAQRVHFGVDRLRMPEDHARIQKIDEAVNRTAVMTGEATIE